MAFTISILALAKEAHFMPVQLIPKALIKNAPGFESIIDSFMTSPLP
jgi:hypothetical protein